MSKDIPGEAPVVRAMIEASAKKVTPRPKPKTVTPTEALHMMGLPIPGGWDKWSRGRQVNFIEVQKRRLKKEHLKRQLIAKKAAEETFRGGVLEFVPSDQPVDPEKPRYIIRGVYGPAAGLARSMIAVKAADGVEINDGGVRHHNGLVLRRFEEDRVVEHLEDRPARRGGVGSWGPREFLFNMLALAAKYGGDCTLYLTHNKMEVGIDADEFEEWVRRANEDPVTMLLGSMPLLEAKGQP